MPITVLAICGAANKKRNTATMLKAAFDGALSVPDTSGEIIYLYDLMFRGCTGCHSCKLLDESKFARCAVQDGLTPVLEKAIAADVILIGSPIYFGDVTGETRSFLERFFFPGMTYNQDRKPTYPKRPYVGWVFTMNAPGETYTDYFSGLMSMTKRLIGESEYVMAYQTQQFDDYSKYAATMFDVDMVMKRHIEQFPQDCDVAFKMGKRLAGASKYQYDQTSTKNCPVNRQSGIIDAGPFYHGRKADLKPGNLLEPGYSSNFGTRENANYVYMSATIDAAIWGAELALGDGTGRIYCVEPTGDFENDPNLTDKMFPGNPTRSYRTRYPLRVISEVLDWEGHSPEAIQEMLNHLEKVKQLGIEAINE